MMAISLVARRCRGLAFPTWTATRSLVAHSSFKSDLHTDQLYPGSRPENRFNVDSVPSKTVNGFDGTIPLKELEITYSHASGSGGQNVNKSSTKVDLRFRLDTASWLSDDVKGLLKEKWKYQLTKDGYFFVKSDRTRSQMLNQADAMMKLRMAIWKALDESSKTRLELQQVDEEEAERRRKTKLRMARERVREKRLHSQMKCDRSQPEW